MRDLAAAGSGNMPTVPGTGLPATSTPLDHPELWHRYFQGHQGDNRHTGHSQIADATDDYLAVQYWLRKAENRSRVTYLNYRKEANRFLAWAALTRNKRLSDITGSDLEAYQRFLRRPEPASLWVSPGGRPPKGSSGWRPPFCLRRTGSEKTEAEQREDKEYGLTPASVVTAMAALKSLFSYLTAVGYLRGSPFLAISTPKLTTEADKTNRRNLSADEVAYLMATIDAMPQETAAEIKAHARTRWLFHLLIFAGLRRSEVAKGRMSDFVSSTDGSLLRVQGKGKKSREVPVTIRLRQELAIYRTALGMSPWPSPDDDSPLVARLIGDARSIEATDTLSTEIPDVISPVTVWKVVKGTFKAASDHAGEEGNSALAKSLASMSTHWLRHTFGTDAMRRLGSPQKVQVMLGHSSINTTMQYSHVAKKELVSSMDAAYADTIMVDEADRKD